MNNEKKFSQCVDVLDQLEKWTYEFYSAAGICDDATTDAPTATIGCSSRPDQPTFHVRPTVANDYPLQGVTIRCFGTHAGSHSSKD